MFLPLERLLSRSARPQTREDELQTLRARFRAQPGPREAGPSAVESARRLRTLRVETSAAFNGVEACGSCAKGRPEPNGHWRGGHCCGGRTLDLFTPTEVAALKLAGVRAKDLRAPAGDHAGCAFRDEQGCALPPEHRPNICVRFVCLELRAELREGESWRKVSVLAAALRDESARFERLMAGDAS